MRVLCGFLRGKLSSSRKVTRPRRQAVRGGPEAANRPPATPQPALPRSQLPSRGAQSSCRGAQCAPVRSYTSAKRPGRIWNPPLRCQRTNLAQFSFCIRRGAFHMLPCNFPTAQGPAGEQCSPLHLPCAFPLSRKPSSFQRKFTSVFVTSPVAIWRCTTYNRGITARALRMCFRSVLFL